jgi:superoxide reductase
MEMKFFICRHCGNIIAYATNKGVPVICCGEKMQELVPNTTDAAHEKHVPVVIVDGNGNGGKVYVKIGSVAHPMTEKHYIEWVGLQTREGNQRKALLPGQAPEVCFMICPGDEVEAVYAYCNLHGLWKA